MNTFHRILMVGVVVCAVLFVNAQNPIVQTHYTADPAPMVHDGRVYVYTSHDEDETVRNFFTMNDWRCYSSTDMVNWTDHGAVLSYKDFEWSRGDAWAGQCIYRNGKFYFYVPVNEKNGGNAIGVAVSDSPTGPFKDAIGEPLIKGYGYIDPTVFIDDDGQAYMYWGNPDLFYVKLNEDMVSYDQMVGIEKVDLTVESFGSRSNTDRTTSYEEAPWLYKRNDLYYLLYAGGPVPEHLAYSTSSSPTGPWEYGGKIMEVISNKGAFTNHPGLIDYNGNSYLFYHNAGLPGGSGFKRSVCVEEFDFEEDGSIPLISPTDEGVEESVSNVNPYLWQQAEMIAWEEGIETNASMETGIYVTDIDNGDYIKVRSVDFGEVGACMFSATVSCDTKPGVNNGGSIEIRLDNKNGTLIGNLPVSYTGIGENWMTEVTNIEDVTGVHDVYFVFKGDYEDMFRFDKWSFTEKTSTKELVAINVTADKYKIDTISGINSTHVFVNAIYSDGTVENVTSETTFNTQNEELISISDGEIVGIEYGIETLMVEYGDFSDEIIIIVKNLASELSVIDLTVNPENVELLTGNLMPVSFFAEFGDGHIEDVTNEVTISNPDPEIATIFNGIITAKNKGKVEIIASYNGELGEAKSTSIVVKVNNRSPYLKNEAENYSEQFGIQTENTDDAGGGENIGFIENGDWIRINSLDFDNGSSEFFARVASLGDGGNIKIHIDNRNGMLIGTCTVAGTGGWQNWETVSCDVSEITGLHDIYLVFEGGSGYLFNMNWWYFNPRVSSSNGLNMNSELVIVSKFDQKYLYGTKPGDIITIYNNIGHKIDVINALSNEVLLQGTSGFIVVEVKRGIYTSSLKTILN